MTRRRRHNSDVAVHLANDAGHDQIVLNAARVEVRRRLPRQSGATIARLLLIQWNLRYDCRVHNRRLFYTDAQKDALHIAIQPVCPKVRGCQFKWVAGVTTATADLEMKRRVPGSWSRGGGGKFALP